MDADPAQATSGARALIEATTKLVLNQLSVAYDEHADVPTLVKAAQKALGLHPEALVPTGKGSETVRRICPTSARSRSESPSCATSMGPTTAAPGSLSFRPATLTWRSAVPAPTVGCSWKPSLTLTPHGGMPPLMVPREDGQFRGYLSTEWPIGQGAWTVAANDIAPALAVAASSNRTPAEASIQGTLDAPPGRPQHAATTRAAMATARPEPRPTMLRSPAK
jgi:hypothetical protein